MMADDWRELFLVNRPRKAVAQVAVAAVLVAASRVWIFHVTDGLSFSWNATVFIQSRFRNLRLQDRRPLPLRPQLAPDVVKVRGDESTSLSEFTSIARLNGPKCLTMHGGR
jgi:hypothetical protein